MNVVILLLIILKMKTFFICLWRRRQYAKERIAVYLRFLPNAKIDCYAYVSKKIKNVVRISG